jgi:chemotaxis protein MotB
VEITLDRRIGTWSSELAARKAREDGERRVRDSFSVDDFSSASTSPEPLK